VLDKRTIIGLVVGSIIIALGAYSFLSNIGPTITINEHFVVEVGEPIFFTIPAPEHSLQYMIITGDTFDLKLESPAAGGVNTGLQISQTSFKDKLDLEWVHLVDGETKIEIQNTGNTELEITAVTNQTPNPFGFTFDLMVIISGMVILGFSLGFTLRKPKGF